MSGIAAQELKAVWGVPVVHMFHTLGLMKQRIAQNEQEAEGDYRLEGEYEVLRKADRVIAATIAEKAQLQWLYQADTDKIEIIPPGVDTCHFYPIPSDEAKEYIGIPPDNQMLLFVGRIEPLKGIDTLIEAIGLMAREGTLRDHRLYLAIIGGDPHAKRAEMTDEMSRLQAMSTRNGLDDFVAFLGRRSQETLPYYYSAAEAVIMPSHYESFGMVALEAMACGTPVVASQVGGLAFLVQDGVTGYHINVGDMDALSERLTTLLEDRELHDKLSGQAAAFAQDYAWRNIARQMRKLYKNILANE